MIHASLFYATLKRPVLRPDFVCKLNELDLDIVLFHATFEPITDALLTSLKERNDVIWKLQSHSSTIRQAHEYFDLVLDVLPIL